MVCHAVAFASCRTPSTGAETWKDLADEDLIAQYLEGVSLLTKEDVADQLFLRHQLRITRWCYRFTRDRESAADCAQEILLRAYRNLHKYRGDCRFSTWLYVIARNVCLTAIQRRASEPVWVAKANPVDFPDIAAFDVCDAVEQAEIRRQKWRFITETLDQTEARVMLLHYGEELPLKAVGHILGLTNKSGAKAYIVSARRKLNAAMRPVLRKTA